MLHSVIVDPRDPEHLYIGLSGGGVFESVDGGKDWRPLNEGSVATFLPDPSPSSVTTRIACACIRCGPTGSTSRTTAASTAWSGPRGAGCASATTCRARSATSASPIELHPRDPDTAWVFPMDGTDVWPRTSPDGRPAVYITRDAGSSWTRCDTGLPRAWFTVKRQAMTVDTGDPVGVYFGTTSGEVWGSTDEGRTWSLIVQHLPEIYSVEFGDPIDRS